MSLPMIVSMLVQALYNVVDSMFVARLSQDALSAVTMVFPVQNLMIALSVGMGVGVNALLSRSLGQGECKKVSSAAMQGISCSAAIYAIFLVLGLFFSEFYMRSQTDIEAIVRGGTEYMTVVCAASFGLFAQIYCEKMLQGTGRTVLSMAVQGVGGIINIILDPILIFGRITLPLVGTVAEFTPLGVAGAAWATVVGQTLAAVLGIFLNIRMNREIHFDRALLRPEPHTLKAILSVGIPSGFIGSIGSVMTYFYNRILIGFSSACVSAFGAYFKLESFVLMPVYGLNNGTVPIIAYNYGARRPDRMKKSVRISVISAEVVVLVGFAVFQLFPGQLLSLFNPDEEMLKIGIRALRTDIAFVYHRRIQHSYNIGFSGARSRAYEHERLYRTPDIRRSPLGVSLFAERKCRACLVCLSHSGTGFAHNVYRVLLEGTKASYVRRCGESIFAGKRIIAPPADI